MTKELEERIKEKLEKKEEKRNAQQEAMRQKLKEHVSVKSTRYGMEKYQLNLIIICRYKMNVFLMALLQVQGQSYWLENC